MVVSGLAFRRLGAWRPGCYSASRLLLTLAVALALVLGLVRPFLLGVYAVPSASMSPALRVGDRVLVSPIPYRFRAPEVGEVAVFHTLGAPQGWGIPRTKRVVAGPGEAIRIQAEEGTERYLLYIDGHPIREPYVHGVMAYELGAHGEVPPGFELARDGLRIPHDCYLLLGDNRNVSVDSHVFGPVPRAALQAKVLAVYWPPQRAGLVRDAERELAP